MSTTIDDRVVEMRFDNRQFESGVQTTLSTLDRLKQSLNLTGAARGLESVNATANRFDASTMANGVETIRSKFSALEVMAVTALANITNSAVNAGKKIVSALTIEPVKMGFEEYETQINAVQTILANTESKGSTLEDVNNALDTLNTYADKTIYNFTQMTRNIGTFTAAGVDLDTSVNAIQGIANLAAVSGSTSQQASTAMYQLSQALAAGRVSLMDWNSVVNAGMGGQVFQDALKRTSQVMGTGVDEAIKKYGSFRESLTRGKWLTTEVLTETLGQFAGAYSEAELIEKGYSKQQAADIVKMSKTATDAATKVKTFTQLMDTLKEAMQTGWSQSWEILIGDFEEAKSLWSGASDYFSEAISKSAEARNQLLEGWAKKGGRDMAIESITNAFKGLMSVVTPIKEAFREVFPPTTSEQLLKITKAIRDFTKHLILSSEESDNLKATFKGVFTVLKVAVDIITKVASGAFKLAGNLSGLVGVLLNVTGHIGKWVNKLVDAAKENNIFAETLEKCSTFINNFASKIKDAYSAFKEQIPTEGWSNFQKVLETVWGVLKKLSGGIVTAISKIGNALHNVFTGGDVKALIDTANSGIFTAILLGLKKTITGFSRQFENSSIGILDTIKNAFGGITKVLDGVKESLSVWQQSLKADILLKIAKAILVLAVSLTILALIDGDKLVSSLGAVTGLFVDLFAAMAVFDKMGGTFAKVSKATILMLGMSVSILILSSAMKNLSSISWGGIAKGLIGVIGLTATIVGATFALSKIKGKAMKGALNIVVFAAAMKILASACKDLSSLSVEGMIKGLTAMGVIMAEISGFAFLMSKVDVGSVKQSATSILIISVAMEIFADAASKFGNMNWKSLAKAGTGMAGILVLAEGFCILSKYANNMIKATMSLTIISVAMEIFADVCKKFGSMNWKSLAKAGVAIGGILTLTAGFFVLSGYGKNMEKAVISLTVISVAMEIFADVCKKFGSMNWGALTKAGTAIGGLLALTAGFSVLAGYSSGIIESSAALLVMAVALNVFAPSINRLGNMGWEQIGKGLITLAGAFTIIGIAGLTLSPIIPSILALAGAVSLIGVAVAAFGAGIFALGAGLASVSASIVAAASSIIAALGVLIVGIIDLIPTIAKALTNWIVELCNIIVDCATSIGDAVRTLVQVVIEILVDCIPLIANGALKLILGVIDACAKYAPKIIDSLTNFIIRIIGSLGNNIPKMVNAAVAFLGKLFDELIKTFSKMDPDTVLKGVVCIGLLTAISYGLAALASLIPSAMIGAVGLGVVVAELAVVLSALGALNQIPGLDWIIGEGGNFLQKIGTAIGQFVGGLAGGIAIGATSVLPEIGENLSAFMNNVKDFVEGVRAVDGAALAGASMLAAMIVEITGASLLERITSFITGKNSLETFSEELIPFGKNLAEFSNVISNVDGQAVTASANAGKALSELANGLPNNGGLVSYFTGDNTLGDFATQLVPFGEAMAKYSEAIYGLNPETVAASANAAKTLSELANGLPNTGGLVAFFSGDNTLSSFAEELEPFGKAMKVYSEAITGLNPEAVTASSNAAKSLSELANGLPNSGGLVSWFTGDNTLSSFAEELKPFGAGMKAYSDEVIGINPEAVMASANAAKSLSELANNLPNTGGIVSWFTGDNDISSFASQLAPFGAAMKAYSDKVTGIDAEAVTSSANAAKTLAELANNLPKEGGWIQSISGISSMTSFISSLAPLGNGIKLYGDAVKGIDAEAVTSSANAAKTISELAKNLPKEGGWIDAVLGSGDISGFINFIQPLGKGIKKFYDAVKGIDSEAVTSSANAAKTISELAKNLPKEGGIFEVFTGQNGLTEFTENLHPFGKAMKKYSNAVTGIDGEAITASANGAKALTEMVDNLPSTGGIKSWFTGDKDLASLTDKLQPFGKSIKKYSNSVKGIKADSITASANAAKTLTTTVKNLPSISSVTSKITGTNSIGEFAKALIPYGKAIKKYSDSVKGVNGSSITASANGAKALTKAINGMVNINTSGVDKFVSSLNKLGDADVDKFLKAFKNSKGKATSAGKSVVTAVISGMKSKSSGVSKVATDMVSKVVKAITSRTKTFQSAGDKLMKSLSNGMKEASKSLETVSKNAADKAVNGAKAKYSSFTSAGKYLGQGLIVGINSKMTEAYNAGYKLGQKAAQGEHDGQQSHSPSKLTIQAGKWLGEGLIIGIGKMEKSVYKAGFGMGESATNSISSAVSKVADMMDTDIDAEPTISPVLDLTNVRSGISTMNGLIDSNPMIGTITNANAISSLMNSSQNGNTDSELLSAVQGLRDDLASSESGITLNVTLDYNAGADANDIANDIATNLRRAIRRGV